MLGIIGGFLLGASAGVVFGWLTAKACGWVE
jgi:hypothetical protein